MSEHVRRCDRCGLPMILGQQRRHHLCDDSTPVGKACTCRPGCSRKAVGDGVGCDPGCVPCALNRGRALGKGRA